MGKEQDFQNAVASGDVSAIRPIWETLTDDYKKAFLKKYNQNFLDGKVDLTEKKDFAEFIVRQMLRYLGNLTASNFVLDNNLPIAFRRPLLEITGNVEEKRALKAIAHEYKTMKREGEISRSGSVHQGTYDKVAPLKLGIYQVFKKIHEEKGSGSTQLLARWILEGNAYYKSFEKNWKHDDERVVLISLLCHHTDSITWYVKNTTSYKIIEGIAHTGDVTALEADIARKQEILERKGGVRLG